MLAPGSPPPKTAAQRRREVGLAAATAAVLGTAAIGAVVMSPDDATPSLTIGAGETSSAAASSPSWAFEFGQSTASVAEQRVVLAALPDVEGDLGQNAVEPDDEVEQARADGRCTIGALSIRLGSTGDGVSCLQEALIEVGFYSGSVNGNFDDATLASVMSYQEANGLFVDGVVGRESAIELKIWPDEESFVVRTPPPAPGATDLWGVELSPVASAGDAAPPIPENSGSGRRVVYDRAGQRVWAIDESERVIRSWLVSGSKYSNEQPGTHTVYSRSEMSTAWNGQAWLPMMIRYQRTEIGHIGFHSIPLHVDDNSPYQTTDELGTRLSGGCQRQHELDATFMWAFAEVGTTVVVL